MTTEELKLIRKQVSAISNYRKVLNNLYKQEVSFSQAAADWVEKGYHTSTF